MEKISNPHYLYRMTVLVAISLLAPVVGAEATCQTMLPVVINAAKDRCTPYVFYHIHDCNKLIFVYCSESVLGVLAVNARACVLILL